MPERFQPITHTLHWKLDFFFPPAYFVLMHNSLNKNSKNEIHSLLKKKKIMYCGCHEHKLTGETGLEH